MITSNFESDILQQPSVIRQLIKDKTDQISELAGYLRSAAPRFILIAARGTSDNAAIYAKYLFSSINRTPGGLAMPSLYSLYKSPPDMSGGLVVGISQSGQTPDVLSVIEEANRQNVPTLSITNDGDSPIARLADNAIVLDVGEEKSVPASKTYLAQLVVVAMLAAHWSEELGYVDDVGRLAGLIEEVLAQGRMVERAARRFGKQDHLVVIGRGLNHCTTYEIALKIKELSYMAAQAYSAADFRHGPIAVLEAGYPVIAIAPNGEALSDMRSMVEEAIRTKADLCVVSNVDDVLDKALFPVRLPDELPEWLSPIVATVPGQLLALHLSLFKGIDPDNPRGLSKVTRTL